MPPAKNIHENFKIEQNRNLIHDTLSESRKNVDKK